MGKEQGNIVGYVKRNGVDSPILKDESVTPEEAVEASEDRICPRCSGLIDVDEFGGRCMSNCGFSW